MKPAPKVISFFVFPFSVLLIHLIASRILDLYSIFPHLDIPFHYIGGFSIAYTSTQILLYLENEKITPAMNPVLFLVLLLALTATATVFWEFMEFIVDRLFATNIQVSLANTMQDQFLGVLGGMTWGLIHHKKA